MIAVENERQTCPRRMSDWGPWDRTDGLDSWTTGHGLTGQDGVGASCSFCGSLNPDRFMDLVRDGWIIEPTDKNYKAYLKRPYSDEERADRKARWLSTDGIARAVRKLGEQDGKTAEQIDADLEQHWREMVEPSTEGETLAKFYFQHLSQEQRDEFIELFNSKRMRVSGGGFYRLPFFARATPDGSAR